MALGLVPACLAGCVTVDDIQTPNGGITLSESEAGAEGSESPSGEAPSDMDDADGVCGALGWSVVRLAGSDQLAAWSAASLAPNCSGTRYQLSALAPSSGSSFAFDVTADGSRVLEATYASTSLGPDGEEWGEYVAPIDVQALSFGAALEGGEQPFAFVGNILGPFGPVSFEAMGCARVRVIPC